MSILDDLQAAGEAYSVAIRRTVKVGIELWRFTYPECGTDGHRDPEYRVATIYKNGVVFSSYFNSAPEMLEGLRIKTLLHKKVTL